MEKPSDILWPKVKFFLYRFICYFSFLLIPILVPKTVALPLWVQGILMFSYILFMVGQWFLLGKEIDHRIQIYFRVNSSVDRIVYRIHLGMFFMIIYFNLLTPLSSKWTYNFFWITWVLLGLFYSWPTRGRIIQESVTSHFGELRYLDGSEKTLLTLSFVMLIVTFPELPNFDSPNTLKLYYDPAGSLSFMFWNFLTINYYPFLKFPELFRLAWGFHFYFVGTGLYLLTFYAFLRMFVSRRSSILGVFAILSSWPITKILINTPGNPLLSSFSLLWVWSILWVIKSATYRSGLFLGLVSFWGGSVSRPFALLYGIQLAVLFHFLKDKTMWFKKQFAKYTLFGFFMIFIILTLDVKTYTGSRGLSRFWPIDFNFFLFGKSFFILAPLGFLILLAKFYSRTSKTFDVLKIDKSITKQFLTCFAIYYSLCLLFDVQMGKDFAFLWVMAFLSVIPVEFIFRSITGSRSIRGGIYFVYILTCLLDSRLEGRIKMFLQTFQ